MKPFSKTKDGVTDSLLRAYVSRPGNPSQACSEFDPDLANAYIERRLPSGSRTRYEHHLSECGACRKNVVALVRLADTSASVSPARDRDHATWLSGARKLFGAMSRPQWAMATAAVLVLVISLPVLLSRDSARPSQQAADSISAEQGQAAANPEAANQPAVGTPALSSRSRGADTPTSAATALKKREAETEATSTPGARSAGVPSIVAGVVDQTQKSDAKSASPAADEAQRKSQSESASQAPGQAGAASSQVAKNLSEEAHKQRQEKDSAQQPPESKPGRVDEPRDREKTAKAEQVAPPPPASPSEVARSNRGLRRAAPPKLALTDSAGSGETVRAIAKKINKKDFFFRDNTWTDKDFDPNKDLPVVTIIRDSNVYKELLAKRANLRPYLEAFSPNERAIIVYKGTVYKLIPQK
jgi:hypothetical protein